MGVNTNATGLTFFESAATPPSPTAFIPIDLTDGTWTISDPANLIATITHSSGVNIFTENTIGASADLIYSANNYTSWRAYKALVDVNGDALTAGPASSMTFVTQIVTPPGSPATANVAAGFAVLPASTSYASIQASGIGMYQAAGSTNGYYHDGAGTNYLTGPALIGSYGVINFGGGTLSLSGAASYNAAGTRTGTLASRNYFSTIGAATDLYFWVEYSKRQNTDAGVAGAQVLARFSYALATPQALPLS